MNSVSDSKFDGKNLAQRQGESGKDVLELLRRFHYGEPAAADLTVKPEDTILPALLNPYRDASAIRYQYPLYLMPPGGTSELAKPAGEYLSSELEALAPGAKLTEGERLRRFTGAVEKGHVAGHLVRLQHRRSNCWCARRLHPDLLVARASLAPAHRQIETVVVDVAAVDRGLIPIEFHRLSHGGRNLGAIDGFGVSAELRADHGEDHKKAHPRDCDRMDGGIQGPRPIPKAPFDCNRHVLVRGGCCRRDDGELDSQLRSHRDRVLRSWCRCHGSLVEARNTHG